MAPAICDFPDPPPRWGESQKQELEPMAQKGCCHSVPGDKITIAPGLFSKFFSFYA